MSQCEPLILNSDGLKIQDAATVHIVYFLFQSVPEFSGVCNYFWEGLWGQLSWSGYKS